jgi:hypothetical protein
MSFESWKAEYYPISARDLAVSEATDRELVAHALRKWRGLLPENLAAHGVVYDDAELIDSMYYGPSCALCQRYTEPECAGCPLAQVLESPSCDEPSRGFKYGLFHAALIDPQVMVEVLEALLLELEFADNVHQP